MQYAVATLRIMQCGVLCSKPVAQVQHLNKSLHRINTAIGQAELNQAENNCYQFIH